MLFNILRAYSVYDKDVGYCQGMAEVAAVLLMFMPEEDAFWVLVQLLAAPKYAMRELFLPGFAALHTHFHVHSCLVQQMIPKLHSHFENLGIQTVFYATKWFSTMFIGVLPFEHTIRVWDIVMFEGTDILYTIAVRTLEAKQRFYLDLSMEDAVPNLISLKEVVTEPANEFIAYATRHPIVHTVLDNYRLEYAKKQFQINREESGVQVAEPVNCAKLNVAASHISSEDFVDSASTQAHSDPESETPPPKISWQGVQVSKGGEHQPVAQFLSFKRRKPLLEDQRARSSTCSRLDSAARPKHSANSANRNGADGGSHDAEFAAFGSLVLISPAARSKPIPVPNCHSTSQLVPVRQAPTISQSPPAVFHQLPASGIPKEAESILGEQKNSQNNSQPEPEH